MSQTHPSPSPAGAFELTGVVTRADRYHIALSREGRIYAIVLRMATSVRPAGAAIQEGARVSVRGRWTYSAFHANRITLCA
jgi:hypothetical protein